jgi:hypothetical protein
VVREPCILYWFKFKPYATSRVNLRVEAEAEV